MHITRTGAVNDSNFADAQSVPIGAPRAAGTTERLNVTGLVPNTRYWVALRSADEVPNWSPISNVLELQTLSTAATVPTISSVSYDPTDAELEVTFSDSMNQSSVEAALVISPELSYDLEWASEAHLRIRIQTPLAADSTYVLAIEPHAADSSGTPLARSFTFRLAGGARIRTQKMRERIQSVGDDTLLRLAARPSRRK